jgi:hypothetical protein
MKQLAMLFVLILSLPIAAHADDASRQAKAKEMLLLMHTDRVMKQMTDNAIHQLDAVAIKLGGSSTSLENQARISDFEGKINKLVSDQLNWSALEPAYVDLYAKNFTDEELDGILAFYKSPSGAALIEKLPSLTTQGTEIVQQRMSIIRSQLQPMIQDFAKSNAAPSAPAPAPAK